MNGFAQRLVLTQTQRQKVTRKWPTGPPAKPLFLVVISVSSLKWDNWSNELFNNKVHSLSCLNCATSNNKKRVTARDSYCMRYAGH